MIEPGAFEKGGREHPRTIGWLGTTALAMGGSNQSLFLMAALLVGQGAIKGQGTAAIPLLILGLVMSWAALPGWTELILMWPNRVGGIAATCGEAFRPYAPVLGNLTGVSYWWGWIPTCGLTALLSASAIRQWMLPSVPVPLLACGLVALFTGVNLLGVKHAARLAVGIGAISALLAFLSALIPIVSGAVDWRQSFSFHLETPFPGFFGEITSAMAGLYLVGFAAPAFEAAACHVGETIDPAKNVPRAMYASAGMATLYFLVLPLVWLGTIGPADLAGDLALTLGPTYAPVFGALGKSLAIGFMMFNMFHGTLAPLTGVARTLSQLSEDGLLPEIFARRTSTDCPWFAIVFTATCAIAFLLIGDPVWLVAAANFTYLIGIALPSVAVWLLRRDQPDRPRPYRAPRGTIALGLIAAVIWGTSTIIGFQQFGLPTVIVGLCMAYSGSMLYAWRKWQDRRKAGLGGFSHSLHFKLTGAMLLVLVLDGAGYYMAVQSVSEVHGHQTALVAGLEDIFVAVAILTITVGLVLPGMIAHSAVAVAAAADRLATGTLADFSRAMEALASGDLDAASARVDFAPVVATSRDEVGAMARSFNTLQAEVARAAMGLTGARDGLRSARDQLTEMNATLEQRVVDRTSELEAAHAELVIAARRAGMAEVAIGVLHNVGNVLNSVNVSAGLVDRRLRVSEAQNLGRLRDLLRAHQGDLGRFLTEDPRGKVVPEYIGRLADSVDEERRELSQELEGLTKNIDHIKVIVSSHQSLARGAHLVQSLDPVDVFEDALRINADSLARHGVRVTRQFQGLPPIVADRHQILQILVNLVTNATRAVCESGLPERTLLAVIDVPPHDETRVRWQLVDNGVGIRPEHATRIFEPGFTTKSDGHGGFGLHTAALSAKSMSGSLSAASDGPGCGACFTLEVPRSPVVDEPPAAVREAGR